ncbi:MAG TPA: TetR/AcrR family transcriptional regulator [Alphaproteobacteria bacterium]|nr:TetR/AcrR family transcriptional regulator [Alphaproteobacteria bacterium]
MGRPRAFDVDEALDAALDRFWRHGYRGTSVRDLADELGIGTASFYHAFQGKRALFLRALERYLDSTTRERIGRLQGSLPPKQAVRAFVREIVEKSVRDRRGCFLVNSALEVAPHEPALRAEIAARLGEIETFFRRSIKAAQRDGSVPKGRPATAVARHLLTVVLGCRVLARSKPDRKILEGAARSALALLE